MFKISFNHINEKYGSIKPTLILGDTGEIIKWYNETAISDFRILAVRVLRNYFLSVDVM